MTAKERKPQVVVSEKVIKELQVTFFTLWDAVAELADATTELGKVMYLHKLDNTIVSARFSPPARRRRRA